MRLKNIVFILMASCSALVAGADDTNVITLYTKLEAFENQAGKVIIKAYAPVGTVAAKTAVISVAYKESADIAKGLKEYGISIGIKEENLVEYRIVVDYDELDSLLEAIEYLSKVDVNVTSLPNFHAIYRTRADLRILVYCTNRQPGTIQPAIQTSYQAVGSRILLAQEQLAEFKFLIREAKAKLDALQKSGH